MTLSKQSTIYLAGHRGMVGSALQRKLQAEGYQNIITRTEIASQMFKELKSKPQIV